MRKPDRLKSKLIDLLPVLGVVILALVFNYDCIIRRIIHIPCLGCGITRAYKALLQFDIVGAFKYHFMFWSIPVLALYYIYDGKLFLNKILNYSVLTLIFVGFAVHWILALLNILPV